MALRLSVAALAQGIGVDPLRPPLAWEVWNGEAWIAADVFSDTTGGLNRSGEIVLMVPNEHELLTLGRRRRLLAAGAADRGRGPASPRTRRRRGSTICRRRPSARPCAPNMPRRSPAEVLGRSDGSPGQEFRVDASRRSLPRRTGETVRVTDRRRLGGMD